VRWIEVALRECRAQRPTPPRAARALALLSVAIDRAARGGGGASVDGASATVLTFLFPQDSDVFDAHAEQAGESRKWFSRGKAIGERVVARGRSDGSDSSWTGVPPRGEPYWVPTPPTFLPPVEPLAGAWRPWNIRSSDAFRPKPPPRPGSDAFARDLREVSDVAATLTSDQRRIALHWADGPGTDTPPGHWNRIAIELAASRHLSLSQTARFLAALNTAQADAFIAAWDAKFTYWSIRPVTAIRRYVDPDWTPLLVTPPFPGYVSGHATTSAAAATVLGHFFPSRAREFDRMAREAALSRLYAGIHFRSDNEAGLELGRRVGTAALNAFPTDPDTPKHDASWEDRWHEWR
jgi:membrane-associated phospholipid phosphatase